MALLFCDGFEIDFADGNRGIWDSVAIGSDNPVSIFYQNSGARTGDGMVVFSGNGVNDDHGYITETLSSAPSEVYCGFGFKRTENIPFSGSNQPIVRLKSSGGTTQFTLVMDEATHKIHAYSGDVGTLLGSSTNAIALDTWYYIEFHLVVHDSTGSIEVRINQATEINVSGIDTNMADGDIQIIDLGSMVENEGHGVWHIDDFCIIDTSGTVTNSWPNGAGVEMLNPNADGNYSQWTSTGGATDNTEVDDVETYGNLPDGDTTKLSHATVGERTSVTLEDTTLAGIVLGVMLLSNVKISASGPDQMAQFLRIGTTDYDQTAFNPSTEYTWRLDILTASPDTAVAFTTAEIDGMEMGWKVE